MTVRLSRQRGVVYANPPHRIARTHNHDPRLAFLAALNSHTLAPMQEAPKDKIPPPAWFASHVTIRNVQELSRLQTTHTVKIPNS